MQIVLAQFGGSGIAAEGQTNTAVIQRPFQLQPSAAFDVLPIPPLRGTAETSQAGLHC